MRRERCVSIYCIDSVCGAGNGFEVMVPIGKTLKCDPEPIIISTLYSVDKILLTVCLSNIGTDTATGSTKLSYFVKSVKSWLFKVTYELQILAW